MVIYIIEHLEPKLYEWCFIEYEHVSKFVGKESLWITNFKGSGRKKLEKIGKVFSKSFRELGLNLDRVCVLDMEASETLKPEDGKKFEYFIIGGILGDHPPRKRTEQEISSKVGCEKRNLGKEQFTVDNAVYVVKEIVSGKKFEEIPLLRNVEIRINEVLTTTPFFTFVSVEGKPFICSKLINYLKKKDDFKL